jgi:hypothetical protein
MGVASPLLRSVEGLRVGDGGAHGTVDRSEPWATGRQMMGGAADMDAWAGACGRWGGARELTRGQPLSHVHEASDRAAG